MINLYYEIINIILSFLDVKSIINFFITYHMKIWILQNTYINKIKEQIFFIKHTFQYEIIEIMGGIKNMITYPILKWKKKYKELNYGLVMRL